MSPLEVFQVVATELEKITWDSHVALPHENVSHYVEPKFRVSLSCLAYVSQVQEVEADSPEEAEQKALAAYMNHQWIYQGLDDEVRSARCGNQ